MSYATGRTTSGDGFTGAPWRYHAAGNNLVVLALRAAAALADAARHAD
jgi:hypothetical protein